MKRFLTTTALVLTLGTTAQADGHTAAFSDSPFDAAVNLKASDLLGARVYATEDAIDPAAMMNADDVVEWDDIGEINEIVLSRGGETQSVVVGVGGFLGMGEKDVAIDMTQLKFISDGENADDYFIVINASLSGIEDAPAYGDAAATDASMSDSEPMLTTPAVVREGYEDVVPADLTAEDLTGARVYGSADEDIGEISELVLTSDGQMDRAIIDVGGFLGLGEKPVAVSMTELQIMRGNGGDLRVYLDSTQEALEALPAYEG